MAVSSTRVIARLLWFFPILLLLLALHQWDVAQDLRTTLENGQPATAQITAFESSDRVDVSYDWVSLRVTLPDGQVLEQEQLSFPHTFVPLLEGKETIDVRVSPGADQEIVIVPIGRAHWRMAAINAGISLLGFLMVGGGVFAWNRYLRRKGDPAQALPPVKEEAA